MKKQTKNILGIAGLIFLVLAVVVLAYKFGYNPSQQTGLDSDNYVQSPTFPYYECTPASRSIEGNHINIETGEIRNLACPSNTDTCDLYVKQTETNFNFFSGARRIAYQVCHANNVCDATKYYPKEQSNQVSIGTFQLPNLLADDRVTVVYQYLSILGWKNIPNGAEYWNTYKPFILWKVDFLGGGKTEYTTAEQGCNFPNSAVPNLLNSIDNIKKQINQQSSTSNTKLDFYKTRNFIGSFVPLAKANVNFVTYNGKDGYCLNRQIFAITTATTNGATYRIVDTNFNTLLANSVTCCPNEKQPNQNCGSDFQWHPIEQFECSAFNPCAGADYQVDSSKKLVRYNCVSSKCVPDYKTVQCTSDSDCLSTQACDTKTFTCYSKQSGVSTAPVITDDQKACEDQGKVYTAPINITEEHTFSADKITQIPAKCEPPTDYVFIAELIIGAVVILGLAYIVITKVVMKSKKRKR